MKKKMRRLCILKIMILTSLNILLILSDHHHQPINRVCVITLKESKYCRFLPHLTIASKDKAGLSIKERNFSYYLRKGHHKASLDLLYEGPSLYYLIVWLISY
jgi:hypothetical protein